MVFHLDTNVLVITIYYFLYLDLSSHMFASEDLFTHSEQSCVGNYCNTPGQNAYIVFLEHFHSTFCDAQYQFLDILVTIYIILYITDTKRCK